jgi:polyisoprenoid-binding protein YceI
VLELEPNHSTIRFSAPIAGGMTRVSGVFTRAVVLITWDEKALERWAVDAAIDAASVDTNNDARDADLRGDLFFAVARHPSLTFRSVRIEKAPAAAGVERYIAHGALSIRGVTKSIAAPFLLTGVDWRDGRPVLGASLRLTINRLDYGVGADWRHTIIPNFLGDAIPIEIDLWTKLGRRAEAVK